MQCSMLCYVFFLGYLIQLWFKSEINLFICLSLISQIRHSMASPPIKRKRVVLSIKQKLKVVERIENGHKQGQLAEEYGVGGNTVSEIWKTRTELRKYVAESKLLLTASDEQRKILRSAKHKDIESAVWRWFCQERSGGKPPSTNLFMEKALMFNQKYLDDGTGGYRNFKASPGQLQNFKQRHGIRKLPKQAEHETEEKSTSNRPVLNPLLDQLCDAIGKEELTSATSTTSNDPTDEDDDSHVSVPNSDIHNRGSNVLESQDASASAVPTHDQAMTAVTELMRWLEKQPEADPTQVMMLKNIQDLAVYKRGLAQIKSELGLELWMNCPSDQVSKASYFICLFKLIFSFRIQIQ